MKVKIKKEHEVVVLKLTLEEARMLCLDMRLVLNKTTVPARRTRVREWVTQLDGVVSQ